MEIERTLFVTFLGVDSLWFDVLAGVRKARLPSLRASPSTDLFRGEAVVQPRRVLKQQ